eukprot:1035579-Pyramimonas_sp.AAC.1
MALDIQNAMNHIISQAEAQAGGVTGGGGSKLEVDARFNQLLLSQLVQYVYQESVTVSQFIGVSGGETVTIKQYSKLRTWIRRQLRAKHSVPEPEDPEDDADEAESPDHEPDEIAQLKAIVKKSPDIKVTIKNLVRANPFHLNLDAHIAVASMTATLQAKLHDTSTDRDMMTAMHDSGLDAFVHVRSMVSLVVGLVDQFWPTECVSAAILLNDLVQASKLPPARPGDVLLD